MTTTFKSTATRFYSIVNAGFASAEDRKSLVGLATAMLDLMDDDLDGLTETEADQLVNTAAELVESFAAWWDIDGVSTFAILKRTAEYIRNDLQEKREAWEQDQAEDFGVDTIEDYWFMGF